MRFYLYYRAALGRVCIKLVVVMGVSWIFDLLSWIHETLDGSRHAFWIVPDLMNALHGVFIFIVVGCQPQVNNDREKHCIINSNRSFHIVRKSCAHHN